jgi:hypothetical protein
MSAVSGKWMAGTSPAMTKLEEAQNFFSYFYFFFFFFRFAAVASPPLRPARALVIF